MTDPQTDFADPEAAAVDEGMVGPGVPVIDSGETAPSAAGTPEEITRPPSKRVASAISGKRYRKRDLVKLETLRPTLAEFIRRDFPDLPPNAMISIRELARYRMRYTEQLLQEEHGEFSELDRQVAESIAKQDTIAENTEEEFEEKRTFGDKLSDQLATFGGSWAFLTSFGVVLFGWMAINVIAGTHAYDPYPFILLNLCLSCLAAIQAPIIMMSQKRQEVKDRLRADNDYRVNLKAELEIRHLHEKLDYLISRQWQRLAEIQQIQMEMMHEAQTLQKRQTARARARAKPKAKPPKATGLS
ncbi:MAG: DUF1003 domain-containing protein [Devosia sp.]|jgi:uncharacterized membrane protein